MFGVAAKEAEDLLHRALHGDLAMSDWPGCLLVASCVFLMLSLYMRVAAEKSRREQNEWLSTLMLCDFLKCDNIQERGSLMNVYIDGPDNPPTMMCRKCWHHHGRYKDGNYCEVYPVTFPEPK